MYNLAIIKKSQGDAEAAIRILADAVEADPTFVGARMALGDLYAETGEAEKAREQYEAIVDMEPLGIDLDEVRAKIDSL